jgi:predicted dehydrogenase
MDLQVISTFPLARGVLIEKPVAALDPQEADCQEVSRRLLEWTEQGGIVSVGYMLRYLAAVRRIK